MPQEPVCRVPLTIEILIVMLLAVLPDVVGSFTFYLADDPGTPTFWGTHAFMLARSLQVSSVILLMIHLTGGDWAKHCLHRPVRFLDLPTSVALVTLCYLTTPCFLFGLTAIGIDLDTDYFDPIASEVLPRSRALAFATILVTGIANGVTEELTMRAWLIPKLEKQMSSQFAALMISSWLFAICHLYQGRAGVAGTLAIGLIFGLYFLKFRRFGPLAIAHAAMDVIPYYWNT